MSWRDGLSGPCLDIAICTNSPLRVMAGPGTGKSFAMQRRVARLMEDDNTNPNRILAVTFTRNAAADLVNKMHGLGISGCEHIVAGTLHAYCFRILSRNEVLQALGRVPRAMITFLKSGVARYEYQPLLEDLGYGTAFRSKRDCTKRIHAFEAAWARLQNEDPGYATDPLDRQFQEALVEWLRFHKAMLIGELVPEALAYLRRNPSAPELSAFDHIIVDEYQDLNKAEQILIDVLSINSSLAIVGDVNQSIYSFRFANPDGIIEFIHRYPHTHDEPLIECQRCPKKVVELADYFIQHNHLSVITQQLTPKPSNPDGEVRIIQWESPDLESQGIAQYVQYLINEIHYGPEDIMILCPRRLLGYSIRDALNNLGLPAHSFYHEEAIESMEAQKALTLLTLFINPDDRVSLRFWLGIGHRNGHAAEYRNLRNFCETIGISPKDALDKILANELTIDGIETLVVKYQQLHAELSALDHLDINGLIDRLFPNETDETKALREIALSAIDRIDDASQLLAELRDQITQPEMPKEGDFVKVMSLHKSKGLTSKVTIISSCIHGLIPTIDQDLTPAEERENLMEKRRLFYVAITRCKEILVLTSILRMQADLAYKLGAKIYGRRGNCRTQSSHFLSELGPRTPAAINGQSWIDNRFR